MIAFTGIGKNSTGYNGTGRNGTGKEGTANMTDGICSQLTTDL